MHVQLMLQLDFKHIVCNVDRLYLKVLYKI